MSAIALAPHDASRARRAVTPILVAICLGGCATPASDIHVATLSMREALDRTTAGTSMAAIPVNPADQAAQVSAMPIPRPSQVPLPALAAPDVRLAWLFDWVDAEGNRHYGSWVAIAITPARWVLTDGSTLPVDLPREPSPGGGSGLSKAPVR